MAESTGSYRIIVIHDPERGVYSARSPELSPCLGEGATRAEATQRLEEDMAALLANLREQGREAPPPLDGAGAPPGLLSLKLSAALNRELVWQAKVDGVEIDQLVEGLLAVGLEGRRRGLGPARPRQSAGGQSQAQGQGQGERGNEAEPGNRRQDPPGPGPRYGVGRGGGPTSARYHDIMEDRASFVEYVRQLETGGARGPGGGGGRGPGGGGGRGPGGPGGGGGRRGPGGPGGGGGGSRGGRGPGGGGGPSGGG